MQNAECRISVADLPRYNFYSAFRREKAEVKGKEKKIFLDLPNFTKSFDGVRVNSYKSLHGYNRNKVTLNSALCILSSAFFEQGSK